MFSVSFSGFFCPVSPVQKNAEYNDYREKRQRAQELQTVRRNIDQILRGAPSQQKKREQER